MKPFRPLTLKRSEPKECVDLTIPESPTREHHSGPPPAKKRLLIHDVPAEKSPIFTKPFSTPLSAPRKPLLTVRNPAAAVSGRSDSNDGPEGYYLVLW